MHDPMCPIDASLRIAMCDEHSSLTRSLQDFMCPEASTHALTSGRGA